MRRFINSLPGKLISHTVAVSLLLPFATLFCLTRAEAQFAQLPTWGVVDFVNKAPQGGDFGKTAAEAMTSELTKTQKYDVMTVETVRRMADGLGLQMPVTGMTSLIRLGQELRASSIVTGEVVNYRVVSRNGTKHADVIMRAIVTDVASGLPVNGAALIGHSTDRAGNVADQTLINEAIASAANSIVNQIRSKTLPHATLLNTQEKSGLINSGSRTGFENGQNVIVLRGREQVATATVYDVEPDQASVSITRSFKGLQPGDRVRVVFAVPEIESKFPKDPNSETPIYQPSNKRASSTGFVQLLLLAGLLGVLFGQGRVSNDNVFTSVTAEAGMWADGSGTDAGPIGGSPGVRVSWGLDLFFRGSPDTKQQFQFQVYRGSIPEQVVAIVPVSLSSVLGQQAVDSVNPTTITNWQNFSGVIGGSTCLNAALPSGPTGTTPPAQPTGVLLASPSRYGVELVYHTFAIDLPITTGGPDCYFLTEQAFSGGFATPLDRLPLISPADGVTSTGLTTFQFDSAMTQQSFTTSTVLANIEYVLEFSNAQDFGKGHTVAVGKFTSNAAGGSQLQFANQYDVTGSGLPPFITSAANPSIYWRVGARNTFDSPGPAPDAIGQRYVFSNYRLLKKPIPPPPPAVVSHHSKG